MTIIDNAVDKPLAKKWAAKHGGMRPTAYKTFVIEPLKAMLRNEGRATSKGCRRRCISAGATSRTTRKGAAYSANTTASFGCHQRARDEGQGAPREIEVKV